MQLMETDLFETPDPPIINNPGQPLSRIQRSKISIRLRPKLKVKRLPALRKPIPTPYRLRRT